MLFSFTHNHGDPWKITGFSWGNTAGRNSSSVAMEKTGLDGLFHKLLQCVWWHILPTKRVRERATHPGNLPETSRNFSSTSSLYPYLISSHGLTPKSFWQTWKIPQEVRGGPRSSFPSNPRWHLISKQKLPAEAENLSSGGKGGLVVAGEGRESTAQRRVVHSAPRPPLNVGSLPSTSRNDHFHLGSVLALCKGILPNEWLHRYLSMVLTGVRSSLLAGITILQWVSRKSIPSPDKVWTLNYENEGSIPSIFPDQSYHKSTHMQLSLLSFWLSFNTVYGLFPR